MYNILGKYIASKMHRFQPHSQLKIIYEKHAMQNYCISLYCIPLMHHVIWFNLSTSPPINPLYSTGANMHQFMLTETVALRGLTLTQLQFDMCATVFGAQCVTSSRKCMEEAKLTDAAQVQQIKCAAVGINTTVSLASKP